MPFVTRLPFTDRQVVQYSNTSITLSGQTYISPTLLYVEPEIPPCSVGFTLSAGTETCYKITCPSGYTLSGSTCYSGVTTASTITILSGATGQIPITLVGLTGYMYESNFRAGGSGLIVNPPILHLSASTGTTTVDVTGYVLKSTNSDGSAEWSPISGVSWSVSACTNPLYVTNITACPSSAGTITVNAGELHIDGDIKITDGTQQAGYVLTTDASGVGTWQYNSTGFSGNTSASCITDLYITNRHGCFTITEHDPIQHISSSATGINSIAWGSGTTASGDFSYSEGFDTIASGIVSHAEGTSTRAYGFISHAEGFVTSAATYHTHAEGRNTLASGIASHAEGRSTIAAGQNSHAEGFLTTASGYASHAQNIRTTASGYGSHAGGYVSIASGSTSFIHSSGSTVIGDRSAVLGGSNITGTTSDTVYVPNLNVREDYILHSDSVLEISNISNISSDFKGSYTEFDWTGITTNIISNNSPDGSSGILIGEFSDYPSTKNHGFLTYYGSGYTRSGSPTTGTDFYRNKFVLKGSDDIGGMVINPINNDSSGTLWWEIDGNSIMILKGDGGTSGNLGIALKEDGTEMPTANLQIGGTGTTGTFKYIDGNQQNGYVLTSDADGLASWQPSSGTTGGDGLTIDPYNNVGSASTLTWDVSGTSTNYEITLTGNTILTMSNVRNGDYGTLITNQDGVGGWTLTFNVAFGPHRVVNGGGGAPTLTATAGATDILSFTYNGAATYWTVGNYYT